jgi:hypothetical protein
MQTNESLAVELETKRGELARRCIDAMYRDEFWPKRFGDRGRQHAEQDSAYHVKYVVAALRADDSRVFQNYAVWLRGVLAARGMCSWHLTESFRELGIAMVDEGIAGRDRAISVLNDGARALDYVEGPAGALQARAAELRTRVQSALETQPYRLDELCSFLLDGLARVDSLMLAKHATFLRQSLADEDERHRLELTLAALGEAAELAFDAETAARVRALLEASAR